MSFPELTEALQHRTLALFLGADLPRAVTGLLSRADLARELALRHGLDESLSLAEVAQRVGQAGNRWAFTDFIRTGLDTAGVSPQPFHRRIVELVKTHGIETIITTAYDNLLELAFREAGVGLNRVVRGSDVNFINPDRPTLIKLYGDAQQPDTLVVTDRDHSDLLRDREREPLLDEVRRALRRNTVFFLGYNLADPDFRFLFDQVAESRFARTAYAVWPGLPEADVRMWRDRGIVILDTDPLGILLETVARPAPDGLPEPTVPLPVSPPPAVPVPARRDDAGHRQLPEPEPQPGLVPTRPALPRHQDFEILIGDRGDRRGQSYPVHVIASPAGEGEGTFEPPFTGEELRVALDRLERYDTDAAFLADFGTRLFAALFAGDVRARYAESVGLTGQDAGLRVRLRIGPPELQELPWELAHDPEKCEFLVLSKRALVTRYLHVPRPTPPLEVEPPLRVLVIVAAPRNQVPLDVDDEVARIRQALRPLLDQGAVEIGVEPHITKRGLRQRLLDGGAHVLHYVGHGDLDLDNGRGILLLEDQWGGTDPLDGQTLGILLRGSSVRLAVLDACLSGRDVSPDAPGSSGRRAGFLGVGPALVDAGLGAVVAMQFPVADESARIFVEDFYAMLARFEPVDVCVSRAREALLLEVGLGQPDWATPVLFMRAPDGCCFARTLRG